MRMSKNILSLMVVILVASAAFGAVYSDGLYAKNTTCYVAKASEIVDITAKNGTAVAVVYQEKEEAPAVDLTDALKDVSGNFTVDVDAQQTENKPVTAVNVSANYSVNKGPVYVQYSHTRNYSRYVDEYIPESNTDFAGTVNNKITFGVSFQPDFSNRSNVAQAEPVEKVAAVEPTTGRVSASSVN
jgi:hypothetical protein